MTFKTFATAQEIFDYVTPLLFEQGERSITLHEEIENHTQCSYRGGYEGELRCAIGFIIPDELYCEAFEGQNMANPALKDALSSVIPIEDEQLTLFLQQFQDAHDYWDDTASDLFRRLQDLAICWKLDRTVLSSFGMVENPT